MKTSESIEDLKSRITHCQVLLDAILKMVVQLHERQIGPGFQDHDMSKTNVGQFRRYPPSPGGGGGGNP